MILLEDLQAICPKVKVGRLASVVEPLNAAMQEFGIDTPEREAAFIAQVAHESAGFYYTRELASGEAYEGRADLGNTQAGDGKRFRGRGFIQITGRANYRAVSDALGADFVANPEWLEETDAAARSAAWFWQSRNLNELADKGDFKAITKRINGGLNGYSDRLTYWERAKAQLGA